MPNVRCSHATKKISKIRSEYLSGSDSYSGKKQGQVLYCKLFDDVIYDEKSKLKSHQELEIALPTELLEKKLVAEDWEKIALKFEKIVTEKMGYDNVSVAIHYRNEESGRSNNKNLHVHLGYIDRIIETTETFEKYDTLGKIPYAVNLSSGKNIKKKDFNSSKYNHFKVEKGDIKLDFTKVDDSILNEMSLLAKKRKLDIDSEKRIIQLRKEIIDIAKPNTSRITFSNRIEKNQNHYVRMQNNKKYCSTVLNEICKEFDLSDTIQKYGNYTVGNWKKDLEKQKIEAEKKIQESMQLQKKIDQERDYFESLFKMTVMSLRKIIKKPFNSFEELVDKVLEFVENIREREDILTSNELWLRELGYLEACINNDISTDKNFENHYNDLEIQLINEGVITDDVCNSNSYNYSL